MSSQNAITYIEAWLVVNSQGDNLERLVRMVNETVSRGIVYG